MQRSESPRKNTHRREIGSLSIDDLTLDEAVSELNIELEKLDRPFLVVTPNLTNVAIFHEDPRVQEAYRRADLILADGWPIGLAAKWHQNNGLSIVPGSLLLPTWVQRLEKPTRFLVVGGKNGLAIVQALHSLSDLVEDVGFDDSAWPLDAEDPKRLTTLLDGFRPDVLLLLLGSPKQEVLAMAAVVAGFKGLILCLGAAGDFLAQMPRRAPNIVQRAGLEWLYRITQEPARLGPRYVKSLRPFLKAIKK